MKAYVSLATGVLWLGVAIFLGRTSFGITWRKGALDPATVAIIFRIALPILFFGWIAPTAFGLWLLWTKR